MRKMFGRDGRKVIEYRDPNTGEVLSLQISVEAGKLAAPLTICNLNRPHQPAKFKELNAKILGWHETFPDLSIGEVGLRS